MRVLGLDPSLTNFGIALFDSSVSHENSCVWKGRIRSSPNEFEDFVDRYAFMRHELERIIKELQPDRIGIEHPVIGSSQSEGMYALFVPSLEVIKSCKKDVVLWSPSQLKVVARTLIKRPSDWKMEKIDMIEAAMKYVGDTGKKWHDGEADAFLIALFSSRFWEYLDGVIDRRSLNSQEVRAFCEKEIFKKGKKSGQIKYKGIEHSQGEKFFLWSKVEGICGKISKDNKNKSIKNKRGRAKSNKPIATSDDGSNAS